MRINKKINAIFNIFKPISLVSAEHDYYNFFLKEIKDFEKLSKKPISELSILVLGCGYRYTDVLLLNQVAKEVVGIDVQNVFYKDGFIKLLKNNLKTKKRFFSSIYNAVKKWYSVERYHAHIEKISSFNFSQKETNIISYTGELIPFEDNYFDIVVSNAVLEHVMDLKLFFKESNRVMKNNGLSFHHYHNYYSFSGGHLPYKNCLKNPWGHLRGIYKTSDAHLNRKTIDEIKSCFISFFENFDIFQIDKNYNKKGVDDDFQYEREDLFKGDIISSLSDYPKDHILTRGYLIYGFKK